jgi:polar amino acid transport system substrate-binding protein
MDVSMMRRLRIRKLASNMPVMRDNAWRTPRFPSTQEVSSMSLRTLRHAAWPAALCTVVLGLAACGDDDSGSGDGASTATAPARSAAVAARVPAPVASKGTFTVGTDATYAPMEFVAPDGRTLQGMDVDLAKALGTVMGLKTRVVKATFDAIIPGLQGGKFDAAMSSMTDTKEREKVVDFVTYFSAGTSFYTRAQGGPQIETLDDLCGEKVSVQKGTTQAEDATAQDKKCKSAGDPGVTVLVLPDQAAANLALSSGRATVSMADSPVSAYQVKQSKGQFKLSGESYGTAPYGVAIPKDSGLEDAVLAGIEELISNGTYMDILEKWGLQEGAIDNPAINAATS